MATIILTSYDVNQVMSAQEKIVELKRNVFLESDHTYDVQAAGRNIDGFEGAVASGNTRVNTGITFDAYVAMYFIFSTTNVGIVSIYPRDEGTLLLLKAIPVEYIGKSAGSKAYVGPTAAYVGTDIGAVPGQVGKDLLAQT